MSDLIDLDHAATTPAGREVLEALWLLFSTAGPWPMDHLWSVRGDERGWGVV